MRPKSLEELIEVGSVWEVDMACRALRGLPRYGVDAADSDLDHFWKHRQALLEQLAFAERQFRNAARAVADKARICGTRYEITRACGLPPE